MPARFNPLSALEGSFLGFPFKIAHERGEGGRRGPLHEYPDRDEPYFEDLGRRAKRFELDLYFVGDLADEQADLFDDLLWKGRAGPLLLPRFRRERVKAQNWTFDRRFGEGNWVGCRVVFVEAGQNQYPSPQTSWPHALLDAALEARTAFADALGSALETVGFGQEVFEDLGIGAEGLGLALDIAAQLAAGQAPSTALAAAALLTAGYVEEIGPVIEAVEFAIDTTSLLSSWAGALAGPTPDRASRARAIEALLLVYQSARDDAWPDPEILTPTETAMVANRGAFGAGVRRIALAEVGRLVASLEFTSYDEAASLRGRLAEAFDAEIDIAGDPAAPGGRDNAARAALQDLGSAALQAISVAGADKARLVPYAVARPRPSRALAQLFYGDDADVTARAAELVARTGAVHPAFLPAKGERLSR